MGIKDQVREAIQLLSAQQIVERTVHTHTGWRKLDGGGPTCMAEVRSARPERSPGSNFAALAGAVYLPAATGAE